MCIYSYLVTRSKFPIPKNEMKDGITEVVVCRFVANGACPEKSQPACEVIWYNWKAHGAILRFDTLEKVLSKARGWLQHWDRSQRLSHLQKEPGGIYDVNFADNSQMTMLNTTNPKTDFDLRSPQDSPIVGISS